MLALKQITQLPSAKPYLKGGASRLTSGSISIDAGEFPVLLLRLSDGSRGGMISIDAGAGQFSSLCQKEVSGAVERLLAFDKSDAKVEGVLIGGNDLTKYRVERFRETVRELKLDVREFDVLGAFYRKIWFDISKGEVSVYREQSRAEDWNPSSGTLGIDSGTRVFSEGQVGGVVANATRFFREKVTFQALREVVLPDWLASRPGEPFSLWSAACSGGAEAYSYAMYLHRLMTRVKRPCPFKIFGTDINERLLEQAKTGIYDVQPREADSYGKYFTTYGKLDGTKLSLNDSIRRFVSFKPFDLKQPVRRRRFSYIICANVFQYYDDDARKHFLTNFINATDRPGYIFVGPLSQAMQRWLPCEWIGRYKLIRVE